MKLKKVYVVHWYYNGGMGFNWYPEESDRDKEFDETIKLVGKGIFKKCTKFDFYSEYEKGALITKSIDDFLHEN